MRSLYLFAAHLVRNQLSDGVVLLLARGAMELSSTCSGMSKPDGGPAVVYGALGVGVL